MPVHTPPDGRRLLIRNMTNPRSMVDTATALRGQSQDYLTQLLQAGHDQGRAEPELRSMMDWPTDKILAQAEPLWTMLEQEMQARRIALPAPTKTAPVQELSPEAQSLIDQVANVASRRFPLPLHEIQAVRASRAALGHPLLPLAWVDMCRALPGLQLGGLRIFAPDDQAFSDPAIQVHAKIVVFGWAIPANASAHKLLHVFGSSGRCYIMTQADAAKAQIKNALKTFDGFSEYILYLAPPLLKVLQKHADGGEASIGSNSPDRDTVTHKESLSQSPPEPVVPTQEGANLAVSGLAPDTMERTLPDGLSPESPRTAHDDCFVTPEEGNKDPKPASQAHYEGLAPLETDPEAIPVPTENQAIESAFLGPVDDTAVEQDPNPEDLGPPDRPSTRLEDPEEEKEHQPDGLFAEFKPQEEKAQDPDDVSEPVVLSGVDAPIDTTVAESMLDLDTLEKPPSASSTTKTVLEHPATNTDTGLESVLSQPTESSLSRPVRESLSLQARRKRSEQIVFATLRVHSHPDIEPVPDDDNVHVRVPGQIVLRARALLAVIAWGSGFRLEEEARGVGIDAEQIDQLLGDRLQQKMTHMERLFLNTQHPGPRERNIMLWQIECLSVLLRVLGIMPRLPPPGQEAIPEVVYNLAFERLLRLNERPGLALGEGAILDLLDLYRRLHWVSREYGERFGKALRPDILFYRRYALEWLISPADIPFREWDEVNMDIMLQSKTSTI